MNVKMIRELEKSGTVENFEAKVNQAIASLSDKEIVDIKYAAVQKGSANYEHNAMIIYK